MMLSMIGRRQLRLAAVGALESANLSVNGQPVTVLSPGDWAVAPETLPAILVRTGHEMKTSFNRGQPEFTTTCTLEVKAIVTADSGEDAQDELEALWYDVEQTLFGNYSLNSMLQQFSTVESAMEVSSDGQRHLAGIAAAFRAEFPEMFEPEPLPSVPGPWPNDPPPPSSLNEFVLTVDATNVVDKTGDYPNPSFPSSVVPSPRETGPDGRAESGLDIPLLGA